jgi:hypothetical protein
VWRCSAEVVAINKLAVIWPSFALCWVTRWSIPVARMSSAAAASSSSHGASASMAGTASIRFRDFYRLCDAVGKESSRLAKSAKIREWVRRDLRALEMLAHIRSKHRNPADRLLASSWPLFATHY